MIVPPKYPNLKDVCKGFKKISGLDLTICSQRWKECSEKPNKIS